MREGIGRFEQMCSEHTPLVYNFLYRYLGDADDAQDALNETFRRAHRSLGRFRGECSERAWLMTIATNVARRTRAKSTRNPHVSLEGLSAMDGRFDPADGQDMERLTLDSFEAGRLLEMLPEPQRAAVWMRVGLQMTDEEVGTALNVPTGTVKSWVWRSLARLRKVCEAEASGAL